MGLCHQGRVVFVSISVLVGLHILPKIVNKILNVHGFYSISLENPIFFWFTVNGLIGSGRAEITR